MKLNGPKPPKAHKPPTAAQQRARTAYAIGNRARSIACEVANDLLRDHQSHNTAAAELESDEALAFEYFTCGAIYAVSVMTKRERIEV
jgi:hypothetical protein